MRMTQYLFFQISRTVMDKTINTTSTMATLDSRIASLPQELQDIILDFTLSATNPLTGRAEIAHDHRPPLSLQINRTLRSKFAAHYYSTTIFTVRLCYKLCPLETRAEHLYHLRIRNSPADQREGEAGGDHSWTRTLAASLHQVGWF
ncbi:hypothetical protein CLAFUW4_11949 [Fulvia fulva]|uniref:Uncharacterized protein n=1 Tax=Passalora fulva TaxID=5499 RepID=A0A9Q8USC9_PASFU|nr:uncharacterized protein CLAFUR5_10991 [Fulvia fulva]KAK4618052.1 hypothetical protein CLAFUR4_11954 [Fulvia fulva]KAK4618621.1 hypothetical protein CLAFUR0_11965 [Fulvia fulva]UJO20637.1 hypothetical protein CLAFUR5_10991 [Fulvia fulva]WPV18050.1 hypothetical protein CLAFUW4_11949 [Fulvia fulva]WPV33636.1 hypothetical protein CLAFUW7_11956 [Fulvia fulva]